MRGKQSYIDIKLHIQKNTGTWIHRHTGKQKLRYTDKHIYIDIKHTQTHTYTNTNTGTHIDTNTDTRLHIHMVTRTNTQTHIYTHGGIIKQINRHTPRHTD